MVHNLMQRKQTISFFWTPSHIYINQKQNTSFHRLYKVQQTLDQLKWSGARFLPTNPRRHCDSRTAPQHPKKPTSIMIPPAPIKIYTAEKQKRETRYLETLQKYSLIGSTDSLPFNESLQFKISPEVGSNRTDVPLYVRATVQSCISGQGLVTWQKYHLLKPDMAQYCMICI